MHFLGVPHAEELYYLFGSPFFGNTTCPGPNNTACPTTWGNYQHWSQTDRGVSKTTMAVWAAFSKQRFVIIFSRACAEVIPYKMVYGAVSHVWVWFSSLLVLLCVKDLALNYKIAKIGIDLSQKFRKSGIIQKASFLFN